jgi:hypothetical protein
MKKREKLIGNSKPAEPAKIVKPSEKTLWKTNRSSR